MAALPAALAVTAPSAVAAAGGSDILAAWQATPVIIIGLLLVGGLYLAGTRRRIRRGDRRRRDFCFLGGLLVLYLALQSPLDALADHFFFVHQLQHLVLMQLTPILLMLAAPQPELIAGLPRRLREQGLAPLLRSRLLHAVFAVLANPVVATALSVGLLFFWNFPPIHDRAVRDGTIHDLMHASMLAAGLFFWWRVLDRRPPPVGLRYVFRIAMLQVSMMLTVLLGGYLAMKQLPLYDVYDRFGVLSGPVDEMLGGFVLWFLGCVAPLVIGVALFRRWMAEENAAAPGGAEPLLSPPSAGRQGVSTLSK